MSPRSISTVLYLFALCGFVAYCVLAPTADDYNRLSNLRAIGVAFQKHHEEHGDFGTPGDRLSWRVHLLPYLGESRLYERFRLNEPWDSEHNRALVARMPTVFAVSGVKWGQTTVHVLTGKESPFGDGVETFSIDNCYDGPSVTIMAVEGGPQVAEVWTKPGGIDINLREPRKPFGDYGDRLKVLLVDGSVHHVKEDCEDWLLGALMTPYGRENLWPDEFIE